MTTRGPWPGKHNPIAMIRFSLMTGFDSGGEPVYLEGIVDSEEERRQVQSLLEPLRGHEPSIKSVTMGEVTLELEDGSSVALRPVFHPSRGRYADLLYTSESQYPMPPELAELLERWRAGSLRDRAAR
jgi:hypothetical protein